MHDQRKEDSGVTYTACKCPRWGGDQRLNHINLKGEKVRGRQAPSKGQPPSFWVLDGEGDALGEKDA